MDQHNCVSFSTCVVSKYSSHCVIVLFDACFHNDRGLTKDSFGPSVLYLYPTPNTDLNKSHTIRLFSVLVRFFFSFT